MGRMRNSIDTPTERHAELLVKFLALPGIHGNLVCAGSGTRAYTCSTDGDFRGFAGCVGLIPSRPKHERVSPSDPDTQRTSANARTGVLRADNYLIDATFGLVMDVEASRAIR